jgi:S1-C subfamily serine protease
MGKISRTMRILLFLLLSTTSLYAFAKNDEDRDEKWDEIRFKGLTPGKSYGISMGSGFFVNHEHIVTNRHVVKNCKNIAVRGAVSPTLVELELVDNELDLAILKSPLSPKKIPYLRNNHDAIKEGDILFSIGYPLEHGKTGDYVIKEAHVLSTKDDKNGLSHIEFTDNVNHGNSGGPLIDRSSNIVGVVTAKLTYRYNDPSIPPKEVAWAIGVEGLIDFLKKSRIKYASNSTYDIFTNYSVDRLTKDYVVNIHCVQDE